MTPERYQRILELFEEASKRAPDGRATFLAESCAGDEDLRRQVEAMLAADRSGGFLEKPLDDLAAGVLAAQEHNIPDRPAWEEEPSLLGQTGNAAGDSTVTMLTPGAQLGPYQIEAPIGAGGMGQVYRAVDTRLGRKVAIKICAQQFTGRFEREARAISALNHPHICTLHDVGPNYLVMELVEGETLAARLQKGRLPMAAVLRYAAEIADALAAAHALGIIHRDLKPQNIMITKSGVKVLDFGLAKSPTDQTLTATRVVMGTPAYMAPEQLEGKPCDARSDIYALGLMLYEMAAGKRLRHGQPPLMEGVPPQFAHVIERCIESEPESRWQSASDVKRELEWAGKTAGTTHVTTQATEPRKGMPRWIWGVAVGVLALGLGLGWTMAHLRQPVAETRTLEQPLVRLDVDLGPGVSLGSQEGAGVILSPDGSRLVYVSQLRLFTRRLDQPKTTELAGTEGAYEPFFSPDGQWVAFFAQGKLKKVSMEGGAAITLCDANNGRGGSWGEDGNIIAALSTNGALSRIPSSGGAPMPVTELAQGEATHRWPQILPGGKAVLFTAHTGAGAFNGANIEVMSLGDHRRKTLVRGGIYGRYLPSGHLIYVNRGTLFAVPFDLGRLEVRGTPAPLLEEVAYTPDTGSAQFDFSGAPSGPGTLVYRGGEGVRLVTVQWLDAAGKTQPLLSKPGLYSNPRLSPDGQRLALAVADGSNQDIWIYEWQRDTVTRLTFGGGFSTAPTWSPDGATSCFKHREGCSGPEPTGRARHNH